MKWSLSLSMASDDAELVALIDNELDEEARGGGQVRSDLARQSRGELLGSLAILRRRSR
jgi:hypothetical protein